jgi:uncharacterized membrane protein
MLFKRMSHAFTSSVAWGNPLALGLFLVCIGVFMLCLGGFIYLVSQVEQKKKK